MNHSFVGNFHIEQYAQVLDSSQRLRRDDELGGHDEKSPLQLSRDARGSRAICCEVCLSRPGDVYALMWLPVLQNAGEHKVSSWSPLERVMCTSSLNEWLEEPEEFV